MTRSTIGKAGKIATPAVDRSVGRGDVRSDEGDRRVLARFKDASSRMIYEDHHRRTIRGAAELAHKLEGARGGSTPWSWAASAATTGDRAAASSGGSGGPPPCQLIVVVDLEREQGLLAAARGERNLEAQRLLEALLQRARVGALGFATGCALLAAGRVLQPLAGGQTLEVADIELLRNGALGDRFGIGKKPAARGRARRRPRRGESCRAPPPAGRASATCWRRAGGSCPWCAPRLPGSG